MSALTATKRFQESCWVRGQITIERSIAGGSSSTVQSAQFIVDCQLLPAARSWKSGITLAIISPTGLVPMEKGIGN
jgi:hypothetical protein